MKIQDGVQGGLEKKCQHWFSDSQDSKLSKNVWFSFSPKNSNDENIRNWTNRHNALLREDRLSFKRFQI